jgi:hypothetical protein
VPSLFSADIELDSPARQPLLTILKRSCTKTRVSCHVILSRNAPVGLITAVANIFCSDLRIPESFRVIGDIDQRRIMTPTLIRAILFTISLILLTGGFEAWWIPRLVVKAASSDSPSLASKVAYNIAKRVDQQFINRCSGTSRSSEIPRQWAEAVGRGRRRSNELADTTCVAATRSWRIPVAQDASYNNVVRGGSTAAASVSMVAATTKTISQRQYQMFK